MPSPLKDRSFERKRHHARKQGDVALPQLILKINGMCADHHLLVGAHALIDCRQKVTQRFTGTGARLNQQMLLLLKSRLHLTDHNLLGFPAFILRQGIFKASGYFSHIVFKGYILQRIAGTFFPRRDKLSPVSYSQCQLTVKGQLAFRLKGLHFPFPQEAVKIPGQITVFFSKQLGQPLDSQQRQAV